MNSALANRPVGMTSDRHWITFSSHWLKICIQGEELSIKSAHAVWWKEWVTALKKAFEPLDSAGRGRKMHLWLLSMHTEVLAACNIRIRAEYLFLVDRCRHLWMRLPLYQRNEPRKTARRIGDQKGFLFTHHAVKLDYIYMLQDPSYGKPSIVPFETTSNHWHMHSRDVRAE